ncbi:putative DNA-binding transcriptional regulator YafY [Sphingomonas sp. UYAg733]
MAEIFGVSERTIYRDLATLAAQGIAAEGIAGVGFVLSEDTFLPPMMLDAAEADAIVFGLRYAMRRGDAAMVDAARSAKSKVEAVLPVELRRKVQLNGLAVAPRGRDRSTIIECVRRALDAERKLAITYQDASGVVSERRVWPLVLGFFEEVEVLVAHCELRSSIRNFRLDRMMSAEGTNERLPAPRRVLVAEWQRTEPGVDF